MDYESKRYGLGNQPQLLNGRSSTLNGKILV